MTSKMIMVRQECVGACNFVHVHMYGYLIETVMLCQLDRARWVVNSLCGGASWKSGLSNGHLFVMSFSSS